MTAHDPLPPSSAIQEQVHGFLSQQRRHPCLLVPFQDPVPYRIGWENQQRLHLDRVSGTGPDAVMFLVHQPVYTMGRGTKPAHLGAGVAALKESGATIEPVNRGGSITYHGPGQLVSYPILKLVRFASGPKEYVRLLEEVLIGTLSWWGIEGFRVNRAPGVWVRLDGEEAKIASIGVRVDHGVTLHGFALNVDLDLAPFSRIMPCGLEQCRVTSIAECLQSRVQLGAVTQRLTEVFSNRCNIAWIGSSPDSMTLGREVGGSTASAVKEA